METENAVKNLFNVVNGASSSLREAFPRLTVCEHRYLQSEMIQTLAHTLYKIGKENHGTDARNEYAIKFCETLARISDTGIASKEDISTIQNWLR